MQQGVLNRAMLAGILVLAFAIGAWLSIPKLRRTNDVGRFVDGRANCNVAMRELFKSLARVAANADNRLPESLDSVTLHKEAAHLQLGCPSDPYHRNYIYPGAGVSLDSTPPDTVILAEHSDNHSVAGGNVLFVDGHVEFWSPDMLKMIETQTGER